MKFFRRTTAILLSLIMILSMCVGSLNVSALKAGADVKGNTVCQALGMDGAAYMNWLLSHEHDSYYLGTPYRPYDHRNLNGDCKGRNGTLDIAGVSGMNCMGFVWHVLRMATIASGGYVSKVRAMAAGRLSFYQGCNITRRYFANKQAMLRSGYLEKGDIIWMIPDQNEYSGTVYHHVGIYWGDGHSDVLWHSNTVTGGQGAKNVISKIYPMLDRNTLYIVLKVGAVQLSTPMLTAAVNNGDGINIQWNKVPGAAKYRVFVKQAGRWKAIADTTNNSYTYKKAADGEKYTFTVRCITAAGKGFTGMYNKYGITCTRLAAPKVTTENKANGVRLNWNKVKGATSYRVYVKGENGYAKITETASLSYTYTKVSSGTAYTFTVRSVPVNDLTGAYNKTGFTKTYVAPPDVTASAEENGITLCWKKPAGASDKYRVFRKDGGEWIRLADISSLTYTDKTAADDGEYTYAVRCLTADAKRYLSSYRAVTVVRGASPETDENGEAYDTV